MSEPDPVLDAMRRHRSVRDFKQGEPVPETDTERAVEAAQCAATSSWIQAYHLLEVTDAQERSALASLAGTLKTQPTAAPAPILSSPAQDWLDEARRLFAPQPLLLAIGQQCNVLEQLLHSRALLSAGLAQLSAPQG